MKLYAISDLHVEHEINRNALEALSPYPDDWLIVAGDVCTAEHYFRWTLDILTQRFAKVIWVPGNHELWTEKQESNGFRGEAKYQHWVGLCRNYGVLTPEDPYVVWPHATSQVRHIIAPLFLLYDYTFRPPQITADQAIPWAAESGVMCVDEYRLKPEPYSSKIEWCHARLAATELRLKEVSSQGKLILINHFPLRYDLVRLKRIPRFSIWCGTQWTEHWHTQFPVDVVVTGHLHMRATDYRDGVRFEEVSLGYPKHWTQERGVAWYLREILPGPATHPENAGPQWHR